jgi:hypothetical protein
MKFPVSESLMNCAKSLAAESGEKHNRNKVAVENWNREAYHKARKVTSSVRFPLVLGFERVEVNLPTGPIDIWEPLNSYVDYSF